MLNYDKKLGNVRTKYGMKGYLAKNFDDFCKRTDLHGYKYIVMKELTHVERFCWTITILISMGVAAYFVTIAYKWYATNPIVTVIESTQGAIWDVPFPAVTICNLNLVSKKSAYNLSMSMSLPGDMTPENVLASLRLAPLLHTPYAASSDQKEQLKQLQFALDHNNMSIESLFEKISPVDTCNDLMERCMWKNAILRCDKLFKPIFTLWSKCCTFNNFASIPNEKRTYSEQSPRRVASCGYQTALTVLVRIDPEDYFSTIVSSQGSLFKISYKINVKTKTFKATYDHSAPPPAPCRGVADVSLCDRLVIIDGVYNFPTQASPSRIMNPSTEVMISLAPERTYATNGIQLFSPEVRQCFYTDERKLDGFKKYSLHNCMTTHRVSILNKTCGCIPFYFPIQYQRSCTFMDMECLDNGYKMIKEELNSKKKVCLTECEHYDYLLEVATGKLLQHFDVIGLNFFKDMVLTNRSLLNVFFSDLVSTRYRRDVYLNWENVLAAFGGILGLMLGFTLMSVFDILIFFIMRVVCQTLEDYFPKRYRLRKISSEKIDEDSKKRADNWIHKSTRNQMVATDYNKWQRHNTVNNRIRY